MSHPYALDRMIITPRLFEVPLNWADPSDGRRIRLAAKEVVAVEHQDDALPLICWFQGGPGYQSRAPESRSGWLAELLKRYRVLLLDQRGTGLSTPFDTGHLPYPDGQQLADYLGYFRADSIVKDAEHIRETLLGPGGRWTICGQSFGGFCCLTYLSFHSTYLDGVLITGGFAPILHTADEVYEALLKTLAECNKAYYRRFPEDIARVRRAVDHLEGTGETTPTGDSISAHHLLSIGELLGRSHGSAQVHTIVERCNSDLDVLGGLSVWSIQEIADVLSLSTNPIYAILHEPIYCQQQAANWAAHKMVTKDARFTPHAQPAPFFTGEMIFPWMFDKMATLQPIRDTARIIAEKEDWPLLYDVEALRSNAVPVVGTIYYDDLYVDHTFALETANIIGNCSVWLTNEYAHRAYNDDPSRVFKHLFAMLDEKIEPIRRT